MAFLVFSDQRQRLESDERLLDTTAALALVVDLAMAVKQAAAATLAQSTYRFPDDLPAFYDFASRVARQHDSWTVAIGEPAGVVTSGAVPVLAFVAFGALLFLGLVSIASYQARQLAKSVTEAATGSLRSLYAPPPPTTRGSHATSWGIAIVAVALAVLVRRLLQPWLGTTLPDITLCPAVAPTRCACRRRAGATGAQGPDRRACDSRRRAGAWACHRNVSTSSCDRASGPARC